MKVTLLTLIVALSAFSISLSASADPECLYRQIRDLPMHWSNPTDCGRYYRCSNKNVKKEVVCSGNKEYNPKTGKCAAAGKGFCKLTMAAPLVGDENVCANEVTGAFMPQSNSCRDYFICNDKAAYPQSCDAGSMFNLTLAACVPDTETECWQNYCLKEANGTYLADQSSCLNFYICDQENAVPQSCSSGSYFNTTARNCEPDTDYSKCWENFCLAKPDGSRLRNANDCQAYYTCQNGTTTAAQCIEGSYFDWQTGECKEGECPSEETPCEPTPPPCNGGGEEGGNGGNSSEECTCPGGYTEGTMLPDPTSCMHYLVCTKGVLVRQECGAGFFFDGNKKICQMDDENQCPQCNANYRRAKRSVDDVEDVEDNADVMAQEVQETVEEIKEAPQTCAGLYHEGELVPHESDCRKYQFCHDGELSLLECGSGSYFDAEERACLRDVDYKCNPRPEPEPEPEPELEPVPKVEPQLFVEAVQVVEEVAVEPAATNTCTCDETQPHPSDCDKYYTCQNGQWVLANCAQGYKYVACYGECVIDEDHTCWPKEDDGCGCTSTPPPYLCNNKPNGFTVPGQNCSSYYTCKNNVAVAGYCSYDSWFNPATERCELDLTATCINPCIDATGIQMKPHPDCTKFFLCNDRKTYVDSCPTGTGFDNDIQVCSPTAKCLKNTCATEPEGWAFPYEDDKTKFYVCISGLPVAADCPAGTQFNANMQVCMVAPSANCDQTKCVAGTSVPPFSTKDQSVNSFCYCRSDGAYESNCKPEFVFNAQLGICYSNAPCDPEVCYEQKEYTVTANRNDTSSFCLCVAQKQVIVPCPCGLQFNAKAELCMEPITQDPNCNPTFCLNAPDNTATAALHNKNGFCLCRYGGSTYMPCLNQGLFNAEIGICIANTAEAQCDKTKCGNGPQIFPTYNDPYGFCSCDDSTPVIHSCPDGKKFSKDQLICLPEFCDSSKCISTTPANEAFPAKDFPYGYCSCNGNDAVFHVCEEGQMFDDVHMVCTAEANLLCNVALCANSAYYPFPYEAKNDEYSFCYCLSPDHVVPLHCPAGTAFDNRRQVCVNESSTTNPENPGCGSNDQCTCPGGYPAGSMLPHPTVCNQFYICSNGKLQLQTCPSGLFWNVKDAACVQDTQGVCLNNGGCATQVATCVGAFKENELIAHAYNPQLYYRCRNAQIREESCAPSYYFDAQTLACVSEYNSRQFYSPRTVMAAASAPATDDFPCLSNEKRSVPANCSQYEICINSNWQRRSCSKQRYYNPERQQCLEPRDDFVCSTARVQGLPECNNATLEQTLPHKDATKCGHYFRCVAGGKWKLKSCRAKEFYARQLRTCLSTKQNICQARNESENALKELVNVDGAAKCVHTDVRAFNGRCDMFLMCLEGVWWFQYCPLGMYFNRSLNYCLPDSVGQCKRSLNMLALSEEYEALGQLNCSREGDLRGSTAACDYFYKCAEGGFWVQQFCAKTGEYFNVSLGACVADDAGFCGEFQRKNSCLEGSKREFPLNCSAYELCVAGQWQKRACDLNETFDLKIKQCVEHKPDGICGSNGLRRACQAGETRAWPLKENCTKFYFCENYEWQPGSCLKGHTFLAEVKSCVPHAANDSCKPYQPTNELVNASGVGVEVGDVDEVDETELCQQEADGVAVAHPYDCTRFHLCLHGESIGEQRCSVDSFFDAQLGYCRPNDGTCKPPTETTTIKCDEANFNELIADPDSCLNYYECSTELVPELKSCSVGEYFDKVLKKCRIDRGECQHHEPPLQHKCANITAHGLRLPHESFCNIYYACVKGLAIPVECPQGQQFNPVLARCQIDEQQNCLNGELVHGNETSYSCGNLTDGTHLPNQNDCTKYYICSEGQATPQKCAPKTYFDAQQLLCVVDEDDACPYVAVDGDDGEGVGGEMQQHEPPDPKICEGKHGLMLPDANNCNDFYVCINGKLKHERCYENFYFNTNSNQCQQREMPTTTTTTTTTAATTTPTTSPAQTTTPASRSSDLTTNSTNALEINLDPELLSSSRAVASPQRCLDKPTNFTQLCKQIPAGGTIAQQGDCRYYISCQDDEPVTQRCRNGEIYDSLIGFCRQNDGTCLLENGQRVGECSERHGELARDSANCRAYFVCINGQKIPAECGDGEYFSKSNNICQIDETGQCSQAPKKTSADDVSCEGLNESVLYAYLPDHCRSYFQCVKGVPKVIECADGLYFNATTTQCVKEITECVLVVAVNTTPQPNSPRAPETQSLCKNAKPGRPYANIEDHCQSYYVCEDADDQKINYTKCPNGTLFSSERRACAAANHVKCV